MKRYNRLSLKQHDAGLKKRDRWFYKGKKPGKRRRPP